MNHTMTSAFLLAAFATVALAQQQGGGAPGGTTGGTASRGTTTPTVTSPGSSSGTNNRSPFPTDSTRPIFVSGRVVLSDGAPANAQIIIERVCANKTYREGYTDSRGRFSFQLGDNRSVFADASVDTFAGPGFGNTGTQLSENALWGCELRAVLAGYVSDTITLSNRRYMDNPDVGTILLRRMLNAPGLTTSATTALAPKSAQKSFEKGRDASEHSKPDEAQKELLKAVTEYPKFAAAWFELGRVYERRDHFEEARDAYAKSIAADGNFVNPHERLYLLAMREQKWEEVADGTERVLRLNPYDFSSAYYYNALANLQLKRLEPAEKSARESVGLTGKQAEPRAHYVLGVILAQRGEFPAAADSLRTFLKVAPAGPDKERVEKLLVEVDRLAQASVTQPSK